MSCVKTFDFSKTEMNEGVKNLIEFLIGCTSSSEINHEQILNFVKIYHFLDFKEFTPNDVIHNITSLVLFHLDPSDLEEHNWTVKRCSSIYCDRCEVQSHCT